MANCKSSIGLELLSELIGSHGANEFIQCFGGREYHFPTKDDNKQAARLKQVVGDSEALILIKHFDGEKCYIRMNRDFYRDIRNKKFLDEFFTLTDSGMGKTVAMHILCPKYGFTKRWGDKIVARHRYAQAKKQTTKSTEKPTNNSIKTP